MISVRVDYYTSMAYNLVQLNNENHVKLISTIGQHTWNIVSLGTTYKNDIQ